MWLEQPQKEQFLSDQSEIKKGVSLVYLDSLLGLSPLLRGDRIFVKSLQLWQENQYTQPVVCHFHQRILRNDQSPQSFWHKPKALQRILVQDGIASKGETQVQYMGYVNWGV